MLALRKRRMAGAHPFLRGGFRPFFFGAATWAVIAIALWLCELSGELSLPTRFDPVAWHRHEMLFGFVGAAVSGFLLTAIAYALLAPLAAFCIGRWSIDARLSRSMVVGIAASVAGGAAWKLFHSTNGARWLFLGGLAVGLFMLFAQ